MSAQEVEEEASTSRGLAAPLISVVMLFVVILGLSAYWWHIARLSTCTASHLKISLGQPSGTAGTSYMDVVLTNTGAGSCALGGYPTAFLADSSGTVLGLGAAANSLYSPNKLILAHNASVHSVLGFPDAANFEPGTCSRASNMLKLYPPGLTDALQITYTQYGCPGFSTTALKPGV